MISVERSVKQTGYLNLDYWGQPGVRSAGHMIMAHAIWRLSKRSSGAFYFYRSLFMPMPRKLPVYVSMKIDEVVCYGKR